MLEFEISFIFEFQIISKHYEQRSGCESSIQTVNVRYQEASSTTKSGSKARSGSATSRVLIEVHELTATSLGGELDDELGI